VLENEHKLGSLVLQMDCTPLNPFWVGEEIFLLQLDPSYTVVTKSFCIKIELLGQPLLKIISLFSVEDLLQMKLKCKTKIHKLRHLKDEK
jgi:hypothetical protein